MRQAGRGQTLLGHFPHEPVAHKPGNTAPGESLAQQLNSAELPVIRCNNIYRAQWHKLAVNCVINPLTALYRVRNGDLLYHTAAERDTRTLCSEICAVSQAMAIPLDKQQLHQRVIAVCEQTADNISSMLQDVRSGRATEIDYINGYLQQKALEHAISCPTNVHILDRVRALHPNSGAPLSG